VPIKGLTYSTGDSTQATSCADVVAEIKKPRIQIMALFIEIIFNALRLFMICTLLLL